MPDSSTPPYIWIAAAAIVVVGLLGFGISDLARFSLSRAWAIGGVCFRESVRRRVLWIIPLAILGAVIVSQLQKVPDERDLIRATTKFCLFATGMVLTLSTIILACTSLPKEIETRVIYTIVTKPATRLELILGKIIGFSRVSALILIIMGAFTYGYLELRSVLQEQSMSVRLQMDPTLSGPERGRLEHFQKAGLLTAESYAHSSDLQIMGAAPRSGDSTRVIYGQGDEELMVPFTVDHARMYSDANDPGGDSGLSGAAKTGFIVGLKIGWQQYMAASSLVTGRSATVQPMFTLDILSADRFLAIPSIQLYNPMFPGAKLAHTEMLQVPASNKGAGAPGANGQIIWAYIPPQQAGALYQQPVFYLHITGQTKEIELFADAASVFLAIAPPHREGDFSPSVAQAEQIPDSQRIAADGPPLVRGRPDLRGGQQLVGKESTDPHAPIAVFHFLASDVPPVNSSGMIPLEFRTTLQHGGDVEEDSESPADAVVSVLPNGADAPTASVSMKFENQETNYGEIPASAVGDSDFDILIRCNAPGRTMALNPTSLILVVGNQPFLWNLLKSLLILWMLTILVIVIAVLCSTFLSWPIAVVLTAVLLMGHWCVTQVADEADATLGRSIASDMGLTDPSKAAAVVNSVNTLSSGLINLGKVLPDIDQFAAIDDIQKGSIISSQTLLDAGEVLLVFGLPLGVLAFLIIKNKEVAP